MSRLVVLNGPPASGKSVLARRYADEHPLTLDLELDVLRSLVGGWREHLDEAGRSVRRLALVVARTQLAAGLDVVVGQCIADAHYLDDLATTAREAGAQHREIVLEAPLPVLEQRWAGRRRPGGPDVEGQGDDGYPYPLYERLRATTLTRPQTRTVNADRDLRAVYRDVVAATY